MGMKFWDRDEDDKIEKAIREAGFRKCGTMEIGWSRDKKCLVIVLYADDEDRIYVYAVRVMYSGDKMLKIAVEKKIDSIEELEGAINFVLEGISHYNVEGVVIRDPATALNMLLTAQEMPAKKPLPVSPTLRQQSQPLQSSGLIGYACDQNYQPTNPVYVTDRMVLGHMIIVGTTGKGKTEVAKRIISELQKYGRTILVLTPESHLKKWQSIPNTVKAEGELTEAKINLVQLNSPDLLEESKEIIQHIIDEYTAMEEAGEGEVRLVVVVDEAHEFDAEALGDAVRVLRKFGVGFIIISHNYTDFDKSVRTNASTHIQMPTKWMNDLAQIKKYQSHAGYDCAKLLLHAPPGYGIVSSSEIMDSYAFLCKFFTAGEVLQPQQEIIVEFSRNDKEQRKAVIISFVGENTGCTVDDVKAELERQGINASWKTVYDDMAELESEATIEVVRKEERGKKRYALSGKKGQI